MVTGFPGKSDCCIFPAVREQQVSGSLTPSPEPLGRSPSLDVEREFSSSNTRKAIVHCQATAASQHDTAVTRGVPEDSPNSPPGARVRLMGLFHPTFLGTKPSQEQLAANPDHLPAWGPGSGQESHTGPVGSGDKDPPGKPLPDSLPLVPVPLHSHSNSNKLLVMSRVSLRAESLRDQRCSHTKPKYDQWPLKARLSF